MDFEEYSFDALKIYACNIQNAEFLKNPNSALVYCTSTDYQIWSTLTNEKRKTEFLAVRYLLWKLNKKYDFYYSGKIPKLKTGEYISISHAQDWVVVMFCKEFNIGVDVELIREKVKHIYSKFVHESEYETFPLDDLKAATLLWSFKETVYKLMHIEGLQFAEQIRVSKNEKEDYRANVLTAQGIFEVPLAYKILNNYVLTFNTGNAQRKS